MKIANVVLNGKFSSELSLHTLSDCVYRPQRFSGAVKQHQGCTFLLFRNGNFVCLGSKAIGQGRRISNNLGKALGLTVVNCSTKNIVMSHNLKFHVDLGKLYDKLRLEKRQVCFEEELFNGIVWKENGGTVRLFHTGNFFVTGLRVVKESVLVCRFICQLCKEFKKQ